MSASAPPPDKSLSLPPNSGYLPSASMNAESSTTTAAISSAPRASDSATTRPLVHVKPPRREDLQPSYARLLPPQEDYEVHSWYGAMINACGNIIGFAGAIPCCKPDLSLCKRRSRADHLIILLRFLLPQPLQACRPRQRRSRHQIWPFLSRS